MDRTPTSPITTQPADQREASPLDEADFMCGSDDPARGATMKGILGWKAARGGPHVASLPRARVAAAPGSANSPRDGTSSWDTALKLERARRGDHEIPGFPIGAISMKRLTLGP